MATLRQTYTINTRLVNARVVIPLPSRAIGVAVSAQSSAGTWSAAVLSVKWAADPSGRVPSVFDPALTLTPSSPACRIGSADLEGVAGAGAIVLELTTIESAGPTPTAGLVVDVAVQVPDAGGVGVNRTSLDGGGA